jgi:putative Mg2+ transporter-C (MgtC) family protein
MTNLLGQMEALLGQSDPPGMVTMCIRLVIAIALGSAVGFERAMRDKPAGFRTNILICLGSCIFTLASLSLIEQGTDRTRIAAQIVSGVGFLGAGAIIRDARGVVGLTTAATIWAMAAIGMSVGFGEYILAFLGAGGVLAVLIALPMLGERFDTQRDVQPYRIVTDKTPDQIDAVERLFKEKSLEIVFKGYFESEGKFVFNIKALGLVSSHERLQREVLLADDMQLKDPGMDT